MLLIRNLKEDWSYAKCLYVVYNFLCKIIYLDSGHHTGSQGGQHHYIKMTGSRRPTGSSLQPVYTVSSKQLSVNSGSGRQLPVTPASYLTKPYQTLEVGLHGNDV